jgi:hypothetical protein
MSSKILFGIAYDKTALGAKLKLVKLEKLASRGI